MKTYRIVKKFRNLDKVEEKEIAVALNTGTPALEVIIKYLAAQVDNTDKKLNNTETLYNGKGDNSLFVATLLAKREANMTLLLLLTEKIELDVDPTKD